MPIRTVAGEIGVRGATTRSVIPSAAQPHWPPFERVVETIATPRGRFPAHRHDGEEVLAYVIEGSASYEYPPGPPTTMTAGSTSLLTAPASVSHAITPAKGHTVRWFAVVASLPHGSTAAARLQTARPEPTPVQADGTIVRRLVGPGSSVTSAAGLACDEIEFVSVGASFQRIGHDRLGVGYVLAGRGRVDGEPLEVGEAALVEDAAGVAIQGGPGFRLVLTSAPRAAAASAPRS